MAKPKLTDWFKRGIKPARVGVYETTEQSDSSPTFQYWTGKYWALMSFDPDRAVEAIAQPSARSRPCWRGLAEQPKEQKK